MNNCYKLEIDDRIVGYFATESFAHLYYFAECARLERAGFARPKYKVTPWFIEGAF